MKIILASTSPRRKELLELAKINFEVIPSNVEEKMNENLPIRKRIEQVAKMKALDIAKSHPNDLVIGADTVVVITEQILGKPKDYEDAKRMIEILQGKTHQVITGVAIIYKNQIETFHEVTNVNFFEMSNEEIENYLQNSDIFDKAGAYAIQEEGALYIKSISGDYYNVMGLPIAKLVRKLKKFMV